MRLWSASQFSLQPGVVLDSVPLGKHFGQVARVSRRLLRPRAPPALSLPGAQDVQGSYTAGQTATAVFWGTAERALAVRRVTLCRMARWPAGASPRNEFWKTPTFLTVEFEASPGCAARRAGGRAGGQSTTRCRC
jgi:hypothetical protein